MDFNRYLDRASGGWISSELLKGDLNGGGEPVNFLLVHLCSGIVHVHVYDVGAGIKGQIPHVLDDHGAGDAPSRVAHQVFQQSKFLAGQIDAPPRPLDPALHPVKLQIVHRQHRFRRQMAAPQQRPNARRQLRERERFAQIIVRSQIQTLHPVFHPVRPVSTRIGMLGFRVRK